MWSVGHGGIFLFLIYCYSFFACRAQLSETSCCCCAVSTLCESSARKRSTPVMSQVGHGGMGLKCNSSGEATRMMVKKKTQ